jgi:hypothetical protein
VETGCRGREEDKAVTREEGEIHGSIEGTQVGASRGEEEEGGQRADGGGKEEVRENRTGTGEGSSSVP